MQVIFVYLFTYFFMKNDNIHKHKFVIYKYKRLCMTHFHIPHQKILPEAKIINTIDCQKFS